MLVYLLFFFILDMLTGQLWVFQASMTLQRLWMLVKCLAVRRKGGLNWHSFYCLSSFISIGKSVKIQQEKCLYNVTLPHLHRSFHFNTCQEKNSFPWLHGYLLQKLMSWSKRFVSNHLYHSINFLYVQGTES